MTLSPTSHRLRETSHLVIFTDLDGTLLDHRYSWSPAVEGLQELRRRKIPVVLCTSKTRGETEQYRREMGIDDPFVVENGGAIFIPRGYFGHLPFEARIDGDYQILESEIPYAELLAALEEIKRRVAPGALGFSELSPDELARITGLSRQQAILARERKHDEPFVILESDPSIDDIRRILAQRGLRYIQGTRFHHISGPHDKGTATRKLIKLFRQKDPNFFSVGLGDGPIDIPFLEQVDLPMVVQNKEGKHHPAFNAPAFLKVYAAGPTGWNMAVRCLLRDGVEKIRALKQLRGEE